MTPMSPNLPAAPILYFEPGEFSAPPAWVASFDKVVQISAGLTTKQQLLTCLAVRLEFPSQIGSHWDALSVCLRDLSWLPERFILLFHEDLPLAKQPAEASEYLRILTDAQQSWKTRLEHSLTLGFPAAVRGRVADLVGTL